MMPDDKFIHESPDGGNTVNSRLFGGVLNNATFSGSSSTANASMEAWYQWIDIHEKAKIHPALAEALERLKVVYELVRDRK